MTSQQDKPKRWRPTFSARTLVIVVSLVCCYFGAWNATDKWGSEAAITQPNAGRINFASSPMPLLVRRHAVYDGGLGASNATDYYLWLFGPMIQLPFSAEYDSHWFGELETFDPPWKSSAVRIVGCESSQEKTGSVPDAIET